MYMGRKVLKPPFDWIVMQDIILDTKPELIIEIGSYEGGFSLWMAHLCDNLGLNTKIIGIDIKKKSLEVSHPRINWVIGSAVSPDTIAKVQDLSENRKGMVIEDSDHKYHTTKKILHLYKEFVAKGCYFVVEDTIVEAMALPPFPGPLPAVKEFIKETDGEFVIDRSREKYILTYNPMGYLLRVK
jgi:cephalosporin hydroxylase